MKRQATLQINDILSVKRAVQRGAGIAMLPDYMVGKENGLVQLMTDAEVPTYDTFFAYPDAMKQQVKLHVFRDFLLSKARSWAF
jgi:DNA-binding transcriptional LysR family regulator